MADWLNQRPPFELVLYGLSAVVTLITIATILFSAFRRLRDSPLTFGSVRRIALKLLSRIDQSGFKPDLVLGVGRSGGFVGGLIAGGLGGLPLELIERFHSNAPGNFVSFPHHEQKMSMLKSIYGEDATVLVVEGVTFRGVTLHGFAEIKNRLAPRWTCKYAVLFKSRASSFRPDFSGKTVSHVPRRYPWHIRKEYPDFIVTEQVVE